MPTLQEILRDPNYVNANPATKQAIFERWAPQDTNFTSANAATQAAIRQRFGVGVAAEPELEQPKDEGFFTNVGKLALEGGERAIGAAKVSPSVISGNVGKEQAKGIAEQLAMKPTVQPKELTEVTTAFKDEAEALKKAEGFKESIVPTLQFMGEFGRQALTNPKGVAYLTAQSAANMAPSILGMIAGGKAGSPLGPYGIVGGAIAGGFAGSAPMEIGAEFIDNVGKELRARGMEPTQENVEALLSDKKFVEKAVSEARTKGTTTAAVDAAMTAGAGRYATGPRRAAIKAAQTEMGAAADAAAVAKRAEEILKQGTAAQRAGRAVKRGAGAVGIDVAGGGLSEAAGQYAAYGEVDPESVALEMLGELGGSAIEVPSAAYATGKDALKAKAKEDAARILEQERAAQEPAPPLKPAAREEQEMSLEDLERAAGLSSVSEEPKTVEELIAEETTAPPAETTTEAQPPAATVIAEESAAASEPAAEPALEEAKTGTPIRQDLQDLIRNQEPATEYDTPENRLRESDAFGQDLSSLLLEERDAYARSAYRNQKLRERSAEKQQAFGAASDAASIAFATNDYEKFRPYESIFPKTAAMLRSEISKVKKLAKADEKALAEIDKPVIAAEEMEGVPAPLLPEIEQEVGKLTEDQAAAIAEREKLEKRTAGTSLVQVLRGTLNDNELSELGGRARKVGKNQFLNLKASKGKTGSSMEDMVNSGKLDIFLPENMRPDHPDYENSESAEYIREKLRNNQYYTYDTEREIERINQDIESIERRIQELLSDDDINKEIQYAVDEQRELDQAAAEPAAEGAPGATEQRQAKAADEDLARREAQLDREQELNDREARLLEERKRLEEERLKLERPTKEDIIAKEDLRKAKEKAEQERKRADEEKAKADEAAADFVLTGSDRAVDEAEARGQKPMFAAEKGQVGYSPDAEEQRVEKELTGKTMLQAADWAIQNAPNAFLKTIAEKVRNRLRELERLGVKLEFEVVGGDRRPVSLYSSRGYMQPVWGDDTKGTTLRLVLNGAAVMENQAGYPPGTRYSTVLHELLHVATRGYMQFAPLSDPLRRQMRDLTNAIIDRFNTDAKAGKLPPVMQKYYKRINNVLESDDEVLAWGLTDEEVQKYFADIKVGDKSVMTRLVELVRSVLGLGKPYESALDRLVKVSESMLDMDVSTIDAVLGNAGKRLGKAAPTTGEQQALFQKEGRENVLGEVVLGSWTEPNETKMAGELGKDDIIYWLQDKMVDTKRVVQAITQTAGKIAERWNPYLQEELYHGRTAKETNDFLTKELRPLMQEMQKSGVTIGEFEQYLHNRHAEEYNKQVAKVNPNDPDMQDGGSGIATEDAKKYLADLPADKRKLYESLADRLDNITKGTRELLVKSGLESRETIEAWEKTFPDYVPLYREDVDFQYTTSSTGTGQGFDVRGPFSRRAMGSKRKVVDILANVAMQRERAIVKSNKNRVAEAVYGLAVQNPNPDFWLAVNPMAEKMPEAALEELEAMGIDQDAIQFLMKEPRQRAVDPKKNEVISRINATLRNNDNVLSMRFNGENRYVFFNPNNERAARAAKALKNLDADQLSYVMGSVAKITRWMASVNTQYNPIFGAYNFLRDIQGAALQLTNTPLAGKQKQVTANVIPALRAIYTNLRKTRKGEEADSEMAKLWDDFQKAGGQTGFRDMFSRSQERSEALQKEFLQMSEGKVKKAGRATLEWLSDYNDTMENAVRLAAYKVALESGMSKQEAASTAKNLTVNFNRKGQVGVQAGALYAFFGAAVQGTTRLVQTLKGPAGRKIMAGGLLLGTIQAVMLAAAGFDDEEPPEFVRERNIIIPIGGDKYIALPMPLGYHVIPGTSRILTEWALSGFKDTPERVASLTGMFLEAFNPIGNAGWSVQSIAPTFADPLVALAENKDWTGKPIARKDFSNLDPTPGYTRAKDTASLFSTKIAEFLNFASGGTKYQPGIVSPTPDQIDYLIGQATGGLGREVLKVEQTITKSITGEDLPPYKIPLVGRFYGETKSSAAESARFYKNLEHLNKLENELKGRRENKEPTADLLKDSPEVRLASRARDIQTDIKKLRDRREQLVERKAPRESVKVVEEQITAKMRLLNEQVERAKK